MLNHDVFRLQNPVLLMALVVLFPLNASAAGAAKVDFVAGPVNVLMASGEQRPATKGAEVQSGETLVTGSGGRVQLRFSDGGMVSLQPGSEYRIDDYRFSGSQDGSEKGVFSLVKGGLRTITGEIGRNNKAAYRVNTGVATIGIRGTEFTIVYTGANSISLATGEGAIEVCNNAGCVVMPSGTSAIVSGPDTRIERSEVRPRLDPAQPDDTRLATFSSSDARQDNGRIAPVSTPLRSGGGYAVAYAYRDDPAAATVIDRVASTSAVFDDFSAMRSFIDGTESFAAGTIAGSFSKDGVLGWGRWSGGTVTDAATDPLADLHYVVGTPTSLAGLTGTANFTSFGGTNATHRDSVTGVVTVGGVATGSMTVNFGTSTIQSASLNIPINGNNIAVNALNINVAADGTYIFNDTNSSIRGFFSGVNASHTGLTYSTLGAPAGLNNGRVSGAIVFSR